MRIKITINSAVSCDMDFIFSREEFSRFTWLYVATMATDAPSVSLLSSINEVVAGFEKKYVEKYEEQKILINKLQQEIEELKNYDQIDNILKILMMIVILI